MAYKVLIFDPNHESSNDGLKPYYLREVQRGNLEIVAYAVYDYENEDICFIDATGKRMGVDDSPEFQLVIISSINFFYRQMKFLELHGIARNSIIDGKVFKTPNLDFSRLLNEGVAYGICDNYRFQKIDNVMYMRVFKIANSNTTLTLDANSYIEDATIENFNFPGYIDDPLMYLISIGKFSSLSWKITFELGLNGSHNYKNVASYDIFRFGWINPHNFLSPPYDSDKIFIGNDVWIGRGCTLKCTNPNKPLIIGDGAVIASDSVVVKNVPPYAIVGGNPAQIIKYRFEPHIIESLLRIKWWDWSLDKIHDNFKYFNDIEKFISLHDRS